MHAGTRPAPKAIPDALEFEQEEDGRWFAEMPSVPGVMAHGATRAEAKLEAMALFVLAASDCVHPLSTS